MSSAQLDIRHDDELSGHPAATLPPFALQPAQPEISPAALKQQVADRVAAHRARRGQIAIPPAAAPQISAQINSQISSPSSSQLESHLGSRTGSETTSRPSRVRSANIAAAVAERYAHSQTYRAFLASEAERAVHQAHASAKIATINAEAIAVAQQQLLADLDHWHMPAEMSGQPASVSNASPHGPLSTLDYAELFDHEPPFAVHAQSFAPVSPPSYTIRPYADADHPSTAPRTAAETRVHTGHLGREFDEDERLTLDDEIAFRHNPVFEETHPPEPIAANLIEFPRQLVAPRRARPRIAEGPLRADETPEAATSQLRIFEVEPGQLTSAPAAESHLTEWASILLSALPSADFAGSSDPDYLAASIPHAAPVSRRLLAAVVDACLILTVQTAFTAVFALALTHLSGPNAVVDIPRGPAVAGALCTLGVLALLYQLLFFTLSDATPGMRYAHIALCTLSNENPTRSAMRRRVFATVLAALPLGLGIFWALLDEDTLGWQDRISRMYQRAY